MKKIGYKLVELSSNNVIQHWSADSKSSPVDANGIPTQLVIPTGIIVCAPTPNVEYDGYMLVDWMINENVLIQPPAMPVISDRQFFQQAALMGIITQDEAIAAVKTGTIPVVLQTIIDGITDPIQKFGAIMLVSGATQFERGHPMVSQIGAALNMSEEQIDQFFLAAAQL